jgi:hypothetical protein
MSDPFNRGLESYWIPPWTQSSSPTAAPSSSPSPSASAAAAPSVPSVPTPSPTATPTDAPTPGNPPKNNPDFLQPFGPQNFANPNPLDPWNISNVGPGIQAILQREGLTGLSLENAQMYSTINDAIWNLERLANQELALYERGELPVGEQEAINLAERSGLGALTGQLAAEGIDPTSSSQFFGGAMQIEQQKAIATENALQQLLQNYFQAQGMTIQADEVLASFTQFDRNLQLQYYQTALQFELGKEQIAAQQKSQQKGMIGQLAGGIGGLFGGGKSIFIATMSAIHELVMR